MWSFSHVSHLKMYSLSLFKSSLQMCSIHPSIRPLPGTYHIPGNILKIQDVQATVLSLKCSVYTHKQIITLEHTKLYMAEAQKTNSASEYTFNGHRRCQRGGWIWRMTAREGHFKDRRMEMNDATMVLHAIQNSIKWQPREKAGKGWRWPIEKQSSTCLSTKTSLLCLSELSTQGSTPPHPTDGGKGGQLSSVTSDSLRSHEP